MNSVGIDISKGKSKTAVMRPFGDIVVSPFEVRHTYSELGKLVKLLKRLDGETCVEMESTGNYPAPVAWLLHGAGLYVSVVNAVMVHDYGNNGLRRAKADKKDAVFYGTGLTFHLHTPWLSAVSNWQHSAAF